MLEKRRLHSVFYSLLNKGFLASVLTIALAVICLLPMHGVNAQLNQSQSTLNTTLNSAGLSQTTNDLPTIIGRIINVILGTVGVIFLALLLFSGYQYMTAGGDAEKIKSALARIRNAVIGLMIIAFSFAIVNFILSWINGDSNLFGNNTTSGNNGGNLSQWGNSGSLGTGQIIDYHYPEPGQTDVPRNTAIVITFVPAIDPASFVDGWTDGKPMSGSLNELNVGIHPESNKDQNLGKDQATVSVSEDRHTVMIKPVDPLGNTQKPTWYEVDLRDGVKNASGTQIFVGNFKNGYTWRFQVSTQIDNTPPRVQSIVPRSGGVYARNIVVQINFNEPVFPSSVAGIFRDGGFQNIQILQSDSGTNEQPINGEFRLSNGYRTVEFMADDDCGVNSCLVKMLCLPAEKTIRGIIKAASLLDNESALAAGSKTGVFNGAVDMAFNSLDGDADGKATGPAGDPAGGMDDWPAATTKNPLAFKTSSQINRDPPFIGKVDPMVESDEIELDKNVDVYWYSHASDVDGVLLASTVGARSFRMFATGPEEKDVNTWWFYSKMKNMDDNGNEATEDSDHVQSMVTIYHRPFIPSGIPVPGQKPEEVNNYYDPYVRHYVMNVYQNCFNPAAYMENGTPHTATTKSNYCNNVESLGTDLGGGNFYCDFIKQP
jgi:hypothetical protein